MRIQKDEPYERWVERVRLFEYGVALQSIAKGEDIETVLDSMSKRISQKLLHPLIEQIKDSYQTDYDPLISRKNYEENYLKYSKRVADHMNDVE